MKMTLKQFMEWQGQYWVHTGGWIAPTADDLNPEDLAAYQEDYARRRAKIDEYRRVDNMA